MNLIELANQHCETFGEIPFLVFEGQTYTNRHIIDSANQLANGLKELGVKPKSRVVVMLKNSPEVIVVYQAILRASAIIVPTLFLLGSKEINHVLRKSEATTIITNKELLPKVNEARDGVRTVKHVIVIDDDEGKNTTSYKRLMEGQSTTLPTLKVKDEFMAVMLFTSGTTGEPKGVVLTHRNLYENALGCSKLDPNHNPEGSYLFFLPLSHSFGLTVMNVGFMLPNTNILLSWFDLETACQLIEKHKIMGFAGVPAVFNMFLEYPEIVDKYDLSSLEDCVSGAAPFPPKKLDAFEARFGCKVYQGYGLSEAGPVVTAHYRGRVRKPGSIGQPLPNFEIKVVDENDEEVEVGEVGELIVFGPCVSLGYYKLPDLTARNFRKGWLYTGDMVKMDEDGYLYIVDRKRDVIIRGGFNIIPRELEEILLRHPEITDAAVIGVKDRVMGEEIKAFVVRESGSTLTEEEIIEHCKDYVADYKTPRTVQFIDQIPRSAVGKVIRKALRS